MDMPCGLRPLEDGSGQSVVFEKVRGRMEQDGMQVRKRRWGGIMTMSTNVPGVAGEKYMYTRLHVLRLVLKTIKVESQADAPPGHAAREGSSGFSSLHA